MPRAELLFEFAQGIQELGEMRQQATENRRKLDNRVKGEIEMKRITDELIDLPNEIHEERLALLDLSDKLDMIKEHFKTWECEAMVDIANELDDKGKPVYSNEAKRAAEINIRKRTNERAYKLDEEIKRLNRQKSYVEASLELLYNKQGNYRAITRIGGEE